MSPSTPTYRAGRVVKPSFDPSKQPIVSSPVLQALAPASLQLDFICSTFLRPVQWQVEPLFANSFLHPKARRDDAVPAAVFMPLVQRPKGVHVLFTRRALHLYDHAGQICFPGGRIEAADADEVAAAIRETHEEIGVAPEYIHPIGVQPGFITSTGFTMTPVIGELRPGFTVTPDKSEVAEIFEVPLSVLMDTAQHHLHKTHLGDGNDRYYFSITWESYFIWGATAALIRNFYHYLAAAQSAELGSTTDSNSPIPQIPSL